MTNMGLTSVHSHGVLSTLVDHSDFRCRNSTAGSPAPVILGRNIICSATESKAPWSSKAPPMGVGKKKSASRRPFRCGVDDLDVEVAIITRSLDRLIQKKCTVATPEPVLRAVAADSQEAAALPDETSEDGGAPSLGALPGKNGSMRRSHVLANFSSPDTFQVSGSKVAHDGPLEFEADMMLRALERLIHRTMDVMEAEEKARTMNDTLEQQVQELKQQNASLLHRLQGGMDISDMPEKLRISTVPSIAEGYSNALPPVLSQRGDRATQVTAESLSVVPPATMWWDRGSIPSSPLLPPCMLDRTCWGQVLQCFHVGKGDYTLRLLSDSKLEVIHIADQYKLLHMADNLLTVRRPVIAIKEFRPPVQEQLRVPTDPPPMNLGIALDLEVLKHDSDLLVRSLLSDPANNCSILPQLSQRPPSRTSRQGIGIPADRPDSSSLRPGPKPLLRPKSSSPPTDRGRGMAARMGIMHYIGTHFGAKPVWQNPVKQQQVLLRTSSVGSHADITDLTKKDLAYFITGNQPGAWVEIDFLCGVVLPVAYSFASAHPMYSGYYPRSWELRASLDQQNWTVLRTHEKDETLQHGCPFGFWELPIDQSETAYFRYFRIVQTGPNSFGTDELQISSFEVYGRLLHVMEDKAPLAPSPAIAPDRGLCNPEANDELPPQPKPKRKAVRKK